MEKRDYTEISMDDYQKIESNISSNISEEKLIESHKYLVGKTCKCDDYEIKDCGVEFVKRLLSLDWGRSIVYCYSECAKEFIVKVIEIVCGGGFYVEETYDAQ